MAWNPDWRVGLARDASNKAGSIQSILVLIYDDGRLEAATYGKTKRLCSEAGKIGDKVFNLIKTMFDAPSSGRKLKGANNMNKMKNRAEAMNKVGAFINDRAPKVLEYLREGFKQKEDGTLYNKDMEALTEILKSEDGVRCYIYDRAHCISFEVQTHYKIASEMVSYYKRQFSFCPETGKDTFKTQRTDYTQKELEDALSEKSWLESEVSKIADKIFDLNLLVNE